MLLTLIHGRMPANSDFFPTELLVPVILTDKSLIFVKAAKSLYCSDAALEPVDWPVAPTLGIQQLLERAGQ
jgi:hypothetical protein